MSHDVLRSGWGWRYFPAKVLTSELGQRGQCMQLVGLVKRFPGHNGPVEPVAGADGGIERAELLASMRHCSFCCHFDQGDPFAAGID